VRVRFQADADFNQKVLAAVVHREPVVDFQTAQAAGLHRRPDPKVLELAAKEGRLLVTHDQTTMPDHFAAFVALQTSSGVLIVPQHLPIALVIEELLIVWDASEAEEWVNRITYLPI
jgi:hypothetical protein